MRDLPPAVKTVGRRLSRLRWRRKYRIVAESTASPTSAATWRYILWDPELDTFSYDMNRIYPGRANGYLTERVAAAHAAAMGAVADFEISIHSGGAHSFLDKAIFVDERPASVELATAMGPGWGCIMSSISPKGSPMAYLKDIGKVGITVELGGRSATSPSAFAAVGRALADSILNILRHYRMYPGAAAYPSPRYRGQQEALLAPASGLFLPRPDIQMLTPMPRSKVTVASRLTNRPRRNQICKLFKEWLELGMLCLRHAPFDG